MYCSLLITFRRYMYIVHHFQRYKVRKKYIKYKKIKKVYIKKTVGFKGFLTIFT